MHQYQQLARLSIHGKEGQRAEVVGFLKFLEGGKGRGRRLKEAEEACGGGRDEGALRLVGLEEEGVKILETGTEL